MEEKEKNQTSDSSPTQQKSSDVSSTPTEPQPQISPNVSNIPPTPQKIFSKKSILIVSLFLLIAVIISGTLYYLSSQKPGSKTTQEPPYPTPNLTENWELFINTGYNYSLKYPPKIFDVIGGCCGPKETEEHISLTNANSVPGEKDPLGWFVITFLPIDNYPENKDIQEKLNLNLNDFANYTWKINNDSISTVKDKKVSSINKIIFNGNEAYQFTADKTFVTAMGGEVLDKENKILISENENVKFIIKFPTDNPIFDQILSTFKFLPDTSDWKTYRNEEYGFEFKYPSDWIIQPVTSENTISQFGEYFGGGEPGGSSPLNFYISIEPYETIFAQDIKNDGTEVINQENVRIDNKIYELYTHKQFEVEAAYKIIDYIPIKDTNRSGLYLYFSHTDAGCSILPSDAQPECLKENGNNNVIYRSTRNQILSTFEFIE